ncbi:MAG TPA: LysR family transcriptional regulator [Actinomycetales bacterium]|nr:LysR family transcriptional regulator [Actinomycetales bacterium]
MPFSGDVPDLRSLDLLVSVARLGGLGRAARDRGITQPAASLRMQQLERRLGVPLLDRSPNGTKLTPEGVVVVDWARAVLESAESFTTGVAALRRNRTSRVTVAASLTVAEYLVPTWLVAVRQAHPDVSLALTVGNSEQVAAQVRDGEAELGFLEGPRTPPGLGARVVGRDSLVVVVPPGHRWARRRRPLDPAELAAAPLVQRETGSGTRETFELAMGKVGQQPVEPVLVLSSTTAIKSAVASGAGPAVLSRLAVADDISSGRLVEVPVAGLEMLRSLRVVWPRGRQLLGPVRDVVNAVVRVGRPRRE